MLRRALFLLFSLFFFAGCAPTFNDNCLSSLECFSNETCAAGSCTLKPITNTNNNMNNNTTGPIDSVDVLPSSANVVLGTTTALTAEATDATGNAVTAPIVWSSENDSIATVDAAGVVTGVAVGTVKIIATSGEFSGESVVTVLGIEIDIVNVTPREATIKNRGTAAFAAEVLGTDGKVMANQAVIWSTTDETIITVDQNGLVTALTTGTAEVIALAGTVQGFGDITIDDEAIETIEITPATDSVSIGGTGQLTGVAKNAGGSELAGRVFSWSSSDDAIATIDANGLVTGVALGTATMTAEAEGKMATAVVTVAAIAVDRVEVGPAKTFTLDQAQALQLTVMAFDVANQPILGRTATWTSSDPLLATVSSLGEVDFLGTGVVTITVDIEGKTDSAVITIEPSAVATVVVSGGGETDVIDGMTLQLTAELRDSDNNLLNGRAIVWTTDDALLATVDANGLVTGVSLGTTTVRATSETIVGTFAIDIVAGPVDLVVVSPATATISIATPTVQLAAALTDHKGNPVVDAVLWTSSNVVFATVDATGLVTRVAAGAVSVTATADGKIGIATITIAD